MTASPAALLQRLVLDAFGAANSVGLDLVDVGQMRDLIETGGQEFVEAYWTEREQSDARGDFERLAGRWAAKEAVMKCLCAGVGEVDPIDIEIITLASGAPAVVLRGSAAAAAKATGFVGCSVSITHESGWAVAIAVGQRDGSPLSRRSDLTIVAMGDRSA